jgi:hypothetical protein
MALSDRFVRDHIARWERDLASPYYPHRRGWPSRLFHHSPLENAVEILRSGFLRSRNDPANQRPRDVAAPSVIDTRLDAHAYVRLYFRPKTPTQYNIEGIRKKGECPYGEATHAPILVMFVFDTHTVLTQAGVFVSDQNMQVASAVAAESEEHFENIPFEKVYHEGAYSDLSIKSHRCAEVLIPSPLDLNRCLKEIWFRSEPERDTLLNKLGSIREHWSKHCQVSDALKVFEKRYTFVEEIGLTEAGVLFSLNHRRDRIGIEIRIDVWAQPSGIHVLTFYNGAHEAKPATGGRWIYKHPLAEGSYRVRVELEGHLAFEGPISVGNTLF